MCLARKIIRSTKKSEEGFVLIARYTGHYDFNGGGLFCPDDFVVGFNGGIKIIRGEKSSSGRGIRVDDICLNFSTSMAATADKQIDSAYDPKLYYSATAPVPDPNVPSMSVLVQH